jgi:hypothetical protein
MIEETTTSELERKEKEQREALEKAVEEKRAKLRNGRNTAIIKSSNGASQDIRGYRYSSANTTERGDSGTTHGIIRDTHNGRSTNEESSTIRHTIRRSSENSGTPVTTTTEATRAGTEFLDRFIPLDVEETIEKRKRGRPRKHPPSLSPGDEKPKEVEKKPKGRPFTKIEAQGKREELQDAIDRIGKHIDRYVWYRTQDGEKEPIWSNMEEVEEGTISNIMIRHAQHSRFIAFTVNAVIHSAEYLDAIVAIVPRILKTRERMKQAPKRVLPSRSERLALFRQKKKDDENTH